jgi:hypothetical protein
LRSKKKAEKLQKFTREPIKPFTAASFTSKVKSSLQRLYDVLKAEQVEMALITNHLRREYKSYIAFDDKQAGESRVDTRRSEVSDDDSDLGSQRVPEKPPLARQLQRSVWRMQQVMRLSKDDIKELAILEYRRKQYLDDLEEWKHTDGD